MRVIVNGRRSMSFSRPLRRPRCDPLVTPQTLMSVAIMRRRKNALGSQVSLPIQSDQDQTTLVSGINIQEKLSSDIVTSTSKPQMTSSSSRLASQCGMKKTLGSELVSLLPCSTHRALEIKQSDKSQKVYDQDQTTLVSILIEHIKNKDNEIELLKAKLSSDIVTSTSKPQTTSSSSSLEGLKKTQISQVSSLLCSACMERIQSDKSLKGCDQDHTTLVSQIDIQENLSSDILSITSKPHQAKRLRLISKVHKPKAFLKKKKKKKSKAVSSTT